MKRCSPLSYLLLFVVLFSSCSVNKSISKQAQRLLLSDSAISQGHIGISVFEPSSGKYLYNHNADKYFIPASNTKLFSWYAGMKYLGDSLVGIRYHYNLPDSSYIIQPTGDPTFLLPEFKHQPVLSFLQNTDCSKTGLVTDFNFRANAYGRGWAWDDYGEAYMTERSAFPINGNLASFYFNGDSLRVFPTEFSLPQFSSIAAFNKAKYPNRNLFTIYRSQFENYFQTANIGRNRLAQETSIPFKTADVGLVKNILQTITHCTFQEHSYLHGAYRFDGIIHSQPSDSLFKPMMHRSDNFFAEQTLIMASNEFLGYMSDKDIIDTILKTHLKDLPQKPKWVDGSGLSRYNLFTPQDFVWLLNKTKNEFSWDRIKNILPTGGEGTLSSYYKDEKGFIYAKTGTLSNNCALSGYLITKKNKLLIFSVLVNNYPGAATSVRRAVERFIKGLREKY
ncbi:MAG: hypothetical protein EOO07_25460 [Chitinophagaceae bacterium]|nr:MAG: hypothetical protein EOO07_25460 [Chitinophagaceae bacterium]